jgi:Abhydrolase family
MSVLAYVLTPHKGIASPSPAVICIPGHGLGVDDIVGIDDKGHDRTDKSGYQHDFAVQVAEVGLVAVANSGHIVVDAVIDAADAVAERIEIAA